MQVERHQAAVDTEARLFLSQLTSPEANGPGLRQQLGELGRDPEQTFYWPELGHGHLCMKGGWKTVPVFLAFLLVNSKRGAG